MKGFLCLAFILLTSFSYAQLPGNGLIAWYPFNNNANDESGNKNNGELNGGIIPATDRFGNSCGALRFMNKGSYISVPNSVSLKSPSTALTIAAWVRPEPANASNDLNLILLAKPGVDDGPDIKPQYCFQIKRTFGDSYSNISLARDFSFEDRQYNNHPLEFNHWYFIAVTYDDDFVQVYQDGKLIAQAPKTKAFTPNDFAMEIGRDIVSGKQYFNGCIDDLRIYNRGLSPFEINALFTDQSAKIIEEEVSVTLPPSIQKNTLKGNCYATAFYAEPTVTMGCGSEVLKQVSGQPSGSQFAVGRNNLIYEFISEGKKTIDSFQITVTDNEAPEFKCPANIVVKGKADGMEVYYPQLSVTDNCPNLRLELLQGKPSGSVFPPGVTSLKFRATDASGNISDCGFTITVTADAQDLREVSNALQEKEAKEDVPATPKANKPTLLIQPVETKMPVAKESRKNTPASKPFKDIEPPRFNCPADTVILLPPNRKGLIYHYKIPVATDNVGIDSIEQVAGTKDGCFLQVGVHPFIFKAYDLAGNTQTCTFSVMIKEDMSAVKMVPPKKLDAALELGNDSVHYEHQAKVGSCELTLLIYDDGEQDNDSVSIIFNDEVIVNRDMIKIKENGIIRRSVSLIPGEENFVIATAWNTGRYGLNTLRIDVFETPADGDKRDLKNRKPVTSKILHSKPGDAGGMLLMCR